MALFFLVLLASLAKTALAVNCDNDFLDFDHTKIQSSGQSTWISETWPNKVPIKSLRLFTTNNFYQASIPYAISGSFGSSDRNVIEAAFREVASTSCVGFGNRISPACIKLNMFFQVREPFVAVELHLREERRVRLLGLRRTRRGEEGHQPGVGMRRNLALFLSTKQFLAS